MLPCYLKNVLGDFQEEEEEEEEECTQMGAPIWHHTCTQMGAPKTP